MTRIYQLCARVLLGFWGLVITTNIIKACVTHSKYFETILSNDNLTFFMQNKTLSNYHSVDIIYDQCSTHLGCTELVFLANQLTYFCSETLVSNRYELEHLEKIS